MAKKNHKDYKVGHNYRYSDIPEDSTDEMEVSDLGKDYIGQNAIHLRFHKDEIDVWFIWSGQANEGIFTCVYNQ